MSTTSNPIVQASEATMLAGGLPVSGTVYEFLNTDKNNALWYLDSNGHFYALGLSSTEDCTCHIANKWMCGVNSALEMGLMTATQYEQVISLGFNVTATQTPTNVGGMVTSIVMGSMSAPVTSVTMTGAIVSTLTMAHTGTAQAGVTIAPLNGYSGVIWVSSNTAKATVDQTGLITGVAAGTTTITVYSIYDPTKFSAITITVT